MHIKIENLQKAYGTQMALDIPAIVINPGEMTGIVGNNGAGKTTLLRLTLNLIKATSGSVLINEQDASKSTGWKIHTASYLDEGFLIDFLTPEEYFYFTGKVYGITPQGVDANLSILNKFLGVEIVGTRKYIRELSAGNRQKVGIAAALLANSKLLVLDEPFNFLDPTSQILLRNIFKAKNIQNNTTMVLSSHNINHLTEICSRIILLENGKIIKDISAAEGDLSEVGSYFLQQIDNEAFSGKDTTEAI
ncbi:MAG TPA: ABC transporter ATP-binding protein [Bacteroidales bacterium]|nr:ABC transporter ATP-binding protein [Bacteroidales bacterium]